MNSTDTALLRETVTAVLTDACTGEVVRAAERGQWPARLWNTFAETGLTLVGISEAAGGSGGSIADLAVVLGAAGKAAAPLPLAETWLAAWLRAAVSLPLPEGPATATWGTAVGRSRLDGTRMVSWLPATGELTVLAVRGGETCVASGSVTAEAVSRSRNLAGEPRDTVDLAAVAVAECVPAPAGLDVTTLRLLGAYTRAVLIVGALDRALELTLRYAEERVQFGRPIGRFQAVAQQTAVLTAEVEAAGGAVALATDALAPAPNIQAAGVAIAVAKARVSRAVGTAASIAHQVHGAIGWTQEHPLQLVTRRALAWRDEWGTERDWATFVGEAAATSAAPSLWEWLVPG